MRGYGSLVEHSSLIATPFGKPAFFSSAFAAVGSPAPLFAGNALNPFT